MSQVIWVVDAFTSEPFKGNPAGVCIVDDFPDVSVMQDIATKLAFSNSAFVKNIGKHKYDIKWFTPHSEAPICGHATIATSHVLFELGLVSNLEEIEFNSSAGKLYTTQTNKWYNLNFPAYRNIEEREFTPELHKIVNTKPIFNGFCNNRMFMEFASVDELRSLRPNLEELKKIDCRALIATAKGDGEYDFQSRYFAPRVGIDEDPVCASAHCLLIPYWSGKLNKKQMIAYQASERGGVIKCADLNDRVTISGEAVTIFKGALHSTDLTKLKDLA